MKTLFHNLPLDTRLTETPARPPVNIQPLVEHFGHDATWRTVFQADDMTLSAIPGFARKTVRAVRLFISENFEFSFKDMMQ